MNKKLLLLFAFSLVLMSVSAQDGYKTYSSNGLFKEELPKASPAHKSYYTVNPTHVFTLGLQYMPIDNFLTTSKRDFAPTIMYSQIRKVGFYAKLGIGGTMQTGTMGVVIRAGKYFRPYIGAGFLFQKADLDTELIDEISTGQNEDITVNDLLDMGVSKEKRFELFEGNTYKYTFNPTFELGTSVLIGRFAMNFGAGYIYNQDFPFYDKSYVLQLGFGYNFTSKK